MNKHYQIKMSRGDGIDWIGYRWAENEAEIKDILFRNQYTKLVFSIDPCLGCEQCSDLGEDQCHSKKVKRKRSSRTTSAH